MIKAMFGKICFQEFVTVSLLIGKYIFSQSKIFSKHVQQNPFDLRSLYLPVVL